MGLFDRYKKVYFENDENNFMESIQRQQDSDILIYLDPCQDFNTNSVITVAPNEQVIFIKNGELYGILPPGRHEVQTENYPVFSRIRDTLTGGESTFTCQVYHINTSEQCVNWGTANAIEIQDFFLGHGEIGVPTLIRGAGEFRICFNIREDENASIQTFLRLMGDKSSYSVEDLSTFFQAQISQEISNVVGIALENMSMTRSINAISSQLKSFATELRPEFDALFNKYGFELVNFAFHNLSIEETETRKKHIDRRIATANISDIRYSHAVQQELMKDISTNPNDGNLAGTGASFGLGIAAANIFTTLASNTFASNTVTQTPNNAQSQTTNINPVIGYGVVPQQTPTQNQKSDPVEVLSKLKELLDAGLITQEKYDAKADEIINNL